MAHGVRNINDQTLFATAQTRSVTQLDFTQFSDFNNYQTFTTNSASSGTEGAGFGTLASTGIGTSNSTSTAGFGGVTGPASAISFTTTSANNATDIASVNTQTSLVPGIPVPTAGLVTKYEFETRIRTAATIHSNTVRGLFRFGFMDSTGMNAASNANTPDRGVFFSYVCDGTTTNTTWQLCWTNWTDAGTGEAFDTGVAVSASTTYRMYLAIEVDTAGVYTTTYKILNENTGTKTEGTATPTDLTTIPGEGTLLSMGGAVVNGKSGVTATTTTVALYTDYMGVRIRRPISREILLGSI